MTANQSKHLSYGIKQVCGLHHYAHLSWPSRMIDDEFFINGVENG